MLARPDISVVIVNWNHVDELMPCLASLYDDGADELQVVVVDNGSEDASVATVRRDFRAVEIVETGANLGFAEGANRGIACARGAWVFTLNNDATVMPGALPRLRTLARAADAATGMLQPTMTFKDRPAVLNSTGIELLGLGYARDRDIDQPLRELERSEVFACTAGAGLYRRAMLDEMRLASGWFDRTFFMYFEDVDLGWRARLAGWRAFHEPDVRVAHRMRASSRRFGTRWLDRICERNRVRMLGKNGSLELWRNAARLLVRSSRRALRDGSDQLGPVVRAFYDGLRQRAAVSALARVDRQGLERAWLR